MAEGWRQLRVVKHADALHLVENWVVAGVNGVPPVHVARHEELTVASPQQLRLVRRRVAPQQLRVVDVKRVRG